MAGEATCPEVFISWSGERALKVARLLVDFVESVTNAKCFLSDRDVESGAWWLEQIRDGLTESKFGIVVLTPENKEAPWLMFEAGALILQHRERVAPYLVGGMTMAEIVGPLSSLQARQGPGGLSDNKDPAEETLRLLMDIAQASGPGPEMVRKRFAWGWDEFSTSVEAIPAPSGKPPPKRSLDDKVDEILTLTRRARATRERRSSPVGYSRERVVDVTVECNACSDFISLRVSPEVADPLHALCETVRCACGQDITIDSSTIKLEQGTKSYATSRSLWYRQCASCHFIQRVPHESGRRKKVVDCAVCGAVDTFLLFTYPVPLDLSELSGS